MEKGLDVPLAECLSLFSFFLCSLFSLSFLSLSHIHTDNQYIDILAAKMQDKKEAPLKGKCCPSLVTGLVYELYAQYQVAILYLCTEKIFVLNVRK